MASRHDEVLAEFREIAEIGTGHLRKRVYIHAPVHPVKEYQPHEIKALREKHHYTQSFFGEYLGVSLKTIQSWEAGINKPTGTTLRLFQVMEQEPRVLDKYILADA